MLCVVLCCVGKREEDLVERERVGDGVGEEEMRGRTKCMLRVAGQLRNARSRNVLCQWQIRWRHIHVAELGTATRRILHPDGSRCVLLLPAR